MTVSDLDEAPAFAGRIVSRPRAKLSLAYGERPRFGSLCSRHADSRRDDAGVYARPGLRWALAIEPRSSAL